MGEVKDTIWYYDEQGKLRIKADGLLNVVTERGVQGTFLGTALVVGFTFGALGAVLLIKWVFGGVPVVSL